MSVDIQEKPKTADENQQPAEAAKPPLTERLVVGFTQVRWPVTLLTAAIMAVGWCSLFLVNNWLQILAGVIPVTAGLYLGRRVKEHLLLHGLLLGFIGYTIGALIVGAYGSLGSTGLVPLPQLINPETGQAATVGALELVLFLSVVFGPGDDSLPRIRGDYVGARRTAPARNARTA
ncbi:MAG: hypothetical protein HC876_19080 [Chloroflexaceae bacterium]|nr:hypothetical protein [Chloroflexaceae bacterium]